MNYWCVDFGIPMPRLKPDLAAAAVVKEINRDREAGHKKLLKAEPKLGKGAMALSAAMAAKDSLEVDDPFKIIGEKAIEGKEIRLQLSANVPTPEAAAKELLGEDADQLDSFREIGVGYALAKNGTPYWCAIFAKPVGGKRPGRPSMSEQTNVTSMKHNTAWQSVSRFWRFVCQPMPRRRTNPSTASWRSLLKAHNRERRLKELDPSHAFAQALRGRPDPRPRHGQPPDDQSHRQRRLAARPTASNASATLPARAGENCAEGQWTVGEVMSGWMKSPGHRANILANFTEMGAGLGPR